MPGVISQRDRRAVIGANPAMRAEDQNLFATERFGIPPHSRILRPSEQIARRPFEQHLRRDRHGPLATGRLRAHVEQRGVARSRMDSSEIGMKTDRNKSYQPSA